MGPLNQVPQFLIGNTRSALVGNSDPAGFTNLEEVSDRCVVDQNKASIILNLRASIARLAGLLCCSSVIIAR